ELSIRADSKAVQVMPEKTGADTIAGLERFADVGGAGAFGIAKKIEIGNAGVPDVTAARENTRADPVVQVIESLGKNGGFVCFAIAVRIYEETDPIAVFIIVRNPLAFMTCHVG